jgi:hypothetical protein
MVGIKVCPMRRRCGGEETTDVFPHIGAERLTRGNPGTGYRRQAEHNLHIHTMIYYVWT